MQGQGAREEAPRVPSREDGGLPRLASRAPTEAPEAFSLSDIREARLRRRLERDQQGVAREERGRGHRAGDVRALIEEFIEGREITVAVLGNPRAITLPPREIFYGKAEDDENAPNFTTWAAKFDDAYRKKWGIKNGKADAIPEKTLEKLNRTARLAYRLFKIDRGMVRLDCRLDANGDVFVIEVNPNPSLARGDDFAQSAKEAGIEYEQLVQKIIDNALRDR